MASPLPSSNPKAEARRRLRERRPGAEQAAAESAAIHAHLLPFLQSGPWKTIALYAALPGEPDILALIDEPALLKSPPLRWVLPRVDGTTLAFHQVRSRLELRDGAFGISEPQAGVHPAVLVSEIDLFLCPGAGFTREGVRIGRGKGYYDRALPLSHPAAMRAGICFRSQLTEELPQEDHDARMNYLITVDGVIDCGLHGAA